MANREYIPVEVKRAVSARDGGRRCIKCHRRNNLELHHIQPHSEGGPDTVENLNWLCWACHREWEIAEAFVEEDGTPSIPYTEWLELPTLNMLRALYLMVQDPLFADQTVDSLRRGFAHSMTILRFHNGTPMSELVSDDD